MQRILIIEGVAQARRRLAAMLVSAGYLVGKADGLPAAHQLLECQPHDLLLLGNDSAGSPALSVFLQWQAGRGEGAGPSGCPVILLIEDADERARIAALRAGADDVLGRPFADEELLARIEAVLRRCRRDTGLPAETAPDGSGLTLDLQRLQVLAGDRPVPLGPTEFRLLSLFMRNPERALSRLQILERVWRSNTHVDERTVDAHVRRLRRALQDTGHDGLIQTVRGVGYRFAGDVGGASAANAPGPVRG